MKTRHTCMPSYIIKHKAQKFKAAEPKQVYTTQHGPCDFNGQNIKHTLF